MPADETRDPSIPTASHAGDANGTRTEDPGHPTAGAPDPDATRTGNSPGAGGVSRPVVPGYELLEEVGSGGMGVVYRARELAFDRDVAVKLLQDRYPARSAAARRFLDEAKITGQLQHPAIPPVHYIGTLPDGRPFLAMKLIKGETLAELLANGRREPAGGGAGQPAHAGRSPHLVPVFAQVCQAVAYAHSRKVIHRDLKPANVMVGNFGEVQVMDWGLAKVLSPAGDAASRERERPENEEDERTEIRTTREGEHATQAGAVLGTPAYMAPEQAGGEVEKVDERADVFGLGAVLCVILTGKPPYTGGNTDSVRLMAIRGETADALARLDSCGADPELVALAKRCLAVKPDDRPRNADEVAKAVTAHLAAAEERARQAELDRVRAEGERAKAEVRAEEQRKRRRTQFALAGAVLLLLAAIGLGAGIASLWQKAEQAKDEAESARKGEADARQLVEQERKKLEMFEYGRTMQVAHQEWRDNNILGARTLLEGTRRELRGWEWHYVHRLCHSSLLTIEDQHNLFAASFSPDGSRIITAEDFHVCVRDARTGTQLLAIEDTNWVRCAPSSADGSRIVTSGSGNTAKVWDATSGALLLTLRGHTEPVCSASWSGDGSRIVTGSHDETAKVWDAKTGDQLLTFRGHKRTVDSVSFSPDGSRIVTTGWERIPRVWDATTGAELLGLKGHTSSVHCVSFSADGSRIVTASYDRTARVWDARTGDELLRLTGHIHWVTSASFSPDGSRIVTGSSDKTARVWDARSGAELLALRGHTREVTSTAFSPDGYRVVTTSEDDTIRVWDASGTTDCLSLKGVTGSTDSACWSPDGLRVVTSGNPDAEGEHAQLWDSKTGARMLSLEGHAETVGSVTFSPNGARIVTGSWDKTAKVWDARSGAELLTLKGHTDRLTCVSFSPDGSRIVTGSADKTAKVWDTASGTELFTLHRPRGFVYSASFSPDGTQIVTSGDDRAEVWDANTGVQLFTLGEPHREGPAAVFFASFSPDGSRIATAHLDGTAGVWDVKTRSRNLTLNGHTASVRSATFSPDGTRIVTGSSDQTARVWDAQTGAELITLKGHSDGVEVASFSPDGSRILTAGGSLTKIWDSRPFRQSRPPDPVRELAPMPRLVGGR